MKLTDSELAIMKRFREERDRLAQLLGAMIVEFEGSKATIMQRIVCNKQEQENYIVRIAEKAGVDISRDYRVDYETGEFIQD